MQDDNLRLAAHAAALRGDAAALERLAHGCKGRPTWIRCVDIAATAASHDNPAVLCWLVSKGWYPSDESDEIVRIAVNCCSLAVLAWYDSPDAGVARIARDDYRWRTAFVHAARFGRIASLDWFASWLPLDQHVYSPIVWAAAHSQTNVLDWLDSRGLVAGYEDIIAAEAVRIDQPGTLDWLRTRRPEWDNIDVRQLLSSAVVRAANTANLATLEWFAKFGLATAAHLHAIRAFLTASRAADFSVLDWVATRATCPELEAGEMLRNACGDGCLALLDWLDRHGLVTRGLCAAYQVVGRVVSCAQLCAHSRCIAVLAWLDSRDLVSADDALADALRLFAHSPEALAPVVEWLVTRARAPLADPGRPVWRRFMLARLAVLVLVGRRSRLRLPPELWDLVATSWD